MGKLAILRDVPSPLEERPRTIRVFTPDLYDREPQTRFGVLYMHDGQNVFAHPNTAVFPSWSADLALERAVGEGRVGPWIIVGVDHGGAGRFEDYSPWPEPRNDVKGRGQTYARFLVEHLKPFIDARYRTRPEARSTATMGSSLGGLISLYLGWRHGEVFGRIGAVSPSVMWCQEELFRRWTKKAGWPLRVYLDAGSEERIEVGGADMSYGARVEAFYTQLRGLGYGEDQLRLVIEAGAPHHESAWERRLPAALEWLLA